jgi:hypothetical protein
VLDEIAQPRVEQRLCPTASVATGDRGASSPAHALIPSQVDHFVVRRATNDGPGVRQASATQATLRPPLRDEVAKAEKAAADQCRKLGITTVGRAAILKQQWNGKHSSREPRRGLSPRVACKNKWACIGALQRNKAFIEQYRDASVAKLAGQDVILPAGSWWLHRFAGVRRAEPETTKRAEPEATTPPS